MGSFGKFGPWLLETLEFFDSAAVEAFGLGFVAQKQWKGVADEAGAHGGEGRSILIEGHVGLGGEDAGPEAGGAEHLLPRERDLLHGKQLLGDGDEAGSEMGDRLEVFEPDDGEGGGGETMRAGILGGAGLALGGARAGAFGGVGAVGSVLLFGNGHKIILSIQT